MAREQKPPKYREQKEARQLKKKLKAVQKQRDQIAANKQLISIEAEISEDAANEGGPDAI
jgi:hypothetical protein